MSFFRDTQHVWTLLLLIFVGGAGLVVIRHQMIPATYGDASGRYGPYRTAALKEIAARPSVLIDDSVCHQCHREVEEERADSQHKSIRCIHCHGLCVEHVDQARQAEKSPGSPIDPAQEWDGNFLTTIDLYSTRDRMMCLSCHKNVLGMPEDFCKINLAEHLEENEVENPTNRNVCWQCHGGHNTEYRELD
ncbi:MAG: hypothetical protein CMJ81_12715 [Planctomycetaceae bacterium]|nr:hypothetical protein [Planctomycetaceae bacterium]